MLTLCCTKKLAKRLDAELTSHNQSQVTTLGDWYANLFNYDGLDIAMCVNQQTRYAIPVSLADCDSDQRLYIALVWRVRDAIRRLGLPDTIANHIVNEYRGGLIIAPTADRSVIGTMNDLISLCEYMLDDECNSGRPFDWNTVWYKFEDQLNQTPHKPLDGDNSRGRMLELLQELG